MRDPEIAALQRALRSNLHRQAWTDFLTSHGSVILQAVRWSIWDSEKAADCFVFACAQLSARDYRRLLQYRPDSGTSFVTWLRVVVRNLALDWHRRQSGRQRVFESVTRLSPLHQEIYRLRYQEGREVDEVYVELHARYPSLTADAVHRMDDELCQSLSSRQHWLMALQQSETVALDPEDAQQAEIADPARSPEDSAITVEDRERLGRAFTRLEPPERLLLQLRFSQGATLAKVAQFAGLPDAQTADRRIRAILDRLKRELA
jgi:RNA polymerase sigma factor (sigma-70 family)